MKPKGTPEQIAARRERGLALLASGQTVTAVSLAIGVSRQTLYSWKNWDRRPRHRRGQPAPGRLCRLSGPQQGQLARVLLKGAYAYGYPTDHWTLERIAQVIFARFGVRYQPSGVWYLMQRMGWSSQRQQRVALDRDEAAIADWQARVWRQVKKVP
jgi:transposase